MNVKKSELIENIDKIYSIIKLYFENCFTEINIHLNSEPLLFPKQNLTPQANQQLFEAKHGNGTISADDAQRVYLDDSSELLQATILLVNPVNYLVIGYLAVQKQKPDQFTTKDEQMLTSFATLINHTVAKYSVDDMLLSVIKDAIHKSIHDLKNPLTSISLTSELLKRKAEDTALVLKFADRLELANQKIFNNLDLLKMLLPTSDKSFKLNISEIQLNTLLEQVLHQKANLIVDTGVTDVVIYGDQHRLTDAFHYILLTLDHGTPPKVQLTKNEENIRIEFTADNLQESSAFFLIAQTIIQMHKGEVQMLPQGCYISLSLAKP